jgi:hypothetical protein
MRPKYSLMHLVQILLPLFDNDGTPLPPAEYAKVRHELMERFGGLTAHTQAPAEGLWKDEEGQTSHDEILVFEVMLREVDRAWWRAYRENLERAFRQDTIVIRVQTIELL